MSISFSEWYEGRNVGYDVMLSLQQLMKNLIHEHFLQTTNIEKH